jgi:hypothetical protein
MLFADKWIELGNMLSKVSLKTQRSHVFSHAEAGPVS